MSIEKMLKYQETDMRLIKLENELKNSECAKKMMSYQAATKKSFDTLTMFNDLAKSDMDQVRKVMSKFSDIVKQVEELMDESVEDCDEKQLDYCAKQRVQCLETKQVGRGKRDNERTQRHGRAA